MPEPKARPVPSLAKSLSVATDNRRDSHVPASENLSIPPKTKDSAKLTIIPESMRGCDSRDDSESDSDTGEADESEFNLGLPYEDGWYNGSNVDLQAGEYRFWLKERKLLEFRALEYPLSRARTHPKAKKWKLLRLKESADDVRNTLAVLHSTPYQPHQFDLQTLKSALRLATIYDHPDLRAYVIHQLDCLSLRTIEKFELSREYKISSWLSDAMDELCFRDEPITEPESRILGYATLVQIAAKREKAQYERGERARTGRIDQSAEGGDTKHHNPPRTGSASGVLAAPEVSTFAIVLP